MEANNEGEMETVAGELRLPLRIPEGPFFDVLSRLSIKDLHRSTGLSREWRDVFINFPDIRKNLPQTLQGFFYLGGCDCRGRVHGGDDRDCDSDDEGDAGARGDDDSARGGDSDDEGDDAARGDDDSDDGGYGSGAEDYSGNSNDNNGNRDSSSYGCSDDDGDDEVGLRSRDSICSGNCSNGLHFLDLLAKSMPVPDDTDTDFSFIPLSAHAHVGSLSLLCSCNGLLLFGGKHGSERYHSQGYIVCNPATKQWRTVPSSGWVLPVRDPEEILIYEEFESTFLFFDPAVPSRFLLIEFWHDKRENLNLVEDKGVNIYSSDTGEWSNRSSEWKRFARGGEWGDEDGVKVWSCSKGSSVVNGMLHFLVKRRKKHDVLIVAVDGEGSIGNVMRWPLRDLSKAVFIGQSQGRLHCIAANFISEGEDPRDSIIMSIDVLRDYDDQKTWERSKFSISGSDLSGEEECTTEDYQVVAIHPDGGLVYFVDNRRGELIQYHMGGKYGKYEQVLRLCTLGPDCEAIPYVPCFSRSLALDTETS